MDGRLVGWVGPAAAVGGSKVAVPTPRGRERRSCAVIGLAHLTAYVKPTNRKLSWSSVKTLS